jgi:hypothetical protein
MVMKWIVLGLGLSVSLAGCASGAKFLSNLEEAPTWFIEQIPEAEAEGYPTLDQTPQSPTDVPSLAVVEARLAALKAEGDAVDATARAQAAPAEPDTETFIAQGLERADLEKFNAEEEAREAEED